MIEELGDILLHVVFHASIGKEDGYFNMTDIVESISDKMIYRHPHVFKEKNKIDSETTIELWDELKKKEKNFKTITEDLQAIAKALPSLIRASKVQKKVSKVGFDWNNVEDASLKVEEELKEVLEVYKTENKEKIKEEVGDLLFACVNVARLLKVNEEEALNITIEKFIKRFSFIEEAAIKSNKILKDMSLEEMDELWNQAKKSRKQ